MFFPCRYLKNLAFKGPSQSAISNHTDCGYSSQSTTMHRISAICAILYLLTTTATGSPSVDIHKTELFEHYKHVEYIAEFPCGVAQPRVFSVNDLFCESEIKGKAYFPDITVLHRCQNSGCCSSSQMCGPKYIETVRLPFKITFLEDIAEHRRGSWIMEYHDLANHTECCCLDPPVPLPTPVDQEPTEPSTPSVSPHTQFKDANHVIIEE